MIYVRFKLDSMLRVKKKRNDMTIIYYLPNTHSSKRIDKTNAFSRSPKYNKNVNRDRTMTLRKDKQEKL
jgi:hypothetical protein